MTRTTREDSGRNVGWSSGPHDDTDDKWNDVQVFVHYDGAVTFQFRKVTPDRRTVAQYVWVADDEAFLIDLAAACLGAVAGIQHNEDSRERVKASSNLEPTSLDGEADVAAKANAKKHLYDKKRKRTKRRS